MRTPVTIWASWPAASRKGFAPDIRAVKLRVGCRRTASAARVAGELVRDTIYCVTIQTVSLAADGVMLLAGAAVVSLAAASVAQVARGRRRQAAALAGAGATVVVVYS